MNRRNKRRLIVVAVLIGGVVVVGVGGTFVRQANRVRIAESSLQEGLAAYEQEDYRTALGRLGIYARYNDQNAEALVALGDARKNIEEPNARHLISARGVLEQAVQVARAQGETEFEIRGLELLLDIHSQLGNWRELADVATQLLEKRPDDRFAAGARIQAHLNRGSNDDALEAAQELVEAQQGSIESHLQMVRVMSRAGRPTRELREYIDGVIAPQHEGSTGLAVIRAVVEADAGRPQVARNILIGAGEAGPSDGVGATLLLDTTEELAARTDDFELYTQSQLWLERGLEEPELAPSLLDVAASRSWRQGASDRAVDFALLAIDRGSESESVFAWGLLGAIERGELDQDAGQRLQNAFDAAIEPHTRARAERWQSVINAFAAQQAGDSSLDQWLLLDQEEVFARGPDGVAAYLGALAFAEQNNLTEAIARLSQLSIQPGWRRARFEQIRLLMGIKQPGAALAVAMRDPGLIQTPAGGALFGDALASRAEEIGQVGSEQTAALDSLLEASPESAVLLAAAARSALVTGDADRARALGRRLAGSEAAEAAVSAIRLAGLLEPVDDQLANEIVDRVAATATSPMEFAAAAVGMAQLGDPDEARALIERESAAAPARQWDLARVQLANIIADAQSLADLETISSTNADDPRVQIEVLAGPVVWSDSVAAGEVIARLRDAEGENGMNWRVFEARRLLLTDGGTAAARAAAQLFEPMFQSETGRRDSSAMLIAAEAFSRTDATDSELRALEYAADGDQPVLALPRLVLLYRNSGDSERAETRLRQFAAIEPVSIPVRAERIRMLEQQGMTDLAGRDIAILAAEGIAEYILRNGILMRPAGTGIALNDDEERVLAMDLEPVDQVLAARLLARIDRADEGLERLEALPESSDAGVRAVVIARFLRELGRTEEALDSLIAHARDGGDADAWLEAARQLVGARRLAEAQDLLEEATATLPDNAAIASFRRSLSDDQDTPMFDRMAQFTVSAAEREDASEGMLLLATIAARYLDGEIDAATAATQLDAISQTRATLYPVWPLLIAVYQQLGQDDAAVARAAAAVEAMPQDHRTARDATQLLMRLSRFQEALGVAGRWRSLAPTEGSRIDADLSLGVIEYARGNALRAVTLLAPHVDVMLADPQERASAIRSYTEALCVLDRMAEAETILLPLAQSDPSWAGFLASTVAAAPVSEANINRALRWLEAVGPMLEAEPQEASFVASSWMALRARTGEDRFATRSVEFAKRAESAGGNSWELQATLATALEDLDQPAEAVAAYERSLEMAGQRIPALLNNAAWLYTHELGDHDRAIELAQEAAETAERLGSGRANRAVFQHTLGKALLAGGNPQEALTSFETGLQLGDTPSLRLGRIEALVALGRGSEAGDAFRRLRPDESWTDAHRQRLEALQSVLGLG